MDSRRLLTFREVARERSFSRAAKTLALTQPAVSQQVAALERQLGTRLLDRRPGGLDLTASGAVLLEHADAIADRLALADVQLAELAGAERVRLRIGAFPSALASLVPNAVARVPEAQVEVEEGGTEELAERVRRGALHIAVGFQDAAQPRREHEGTVRHDLVREPFLIAMSPDHRLAGRESVRLADLADESWTAPSTDHLVARACRAAGFEPRIVSITRDLLAIRALIAQNLVVALVPQLQGELPGVIRRPLEGPVPQRDVYALLPAGARHPLAQRMVAALAEVGSAPA